MVKANDKALDELIDEEMDTLDTSSITDDMTSPHTPLVDDQANTKSDLNEELNIPLDDSGETAFNADNPDLASDDDIDDVGEDFGVNYADDEELDITKKINMNTED